jgi:hypothetical protein
VLGSKNITKILLVAVLSVKFNASRTSSNL